MTTFHLTRTSVHGFAVEPIRYASFETAAEAEASRKIYDATGDNFKVVHDGCGSHTVLGPCDGKVRCPDCIDKGARYGDNY